MMVRLEFEENLRKIRGQSALFSEEPEGYGPTLPFATNEEDTEKNSNLLYVIEARSDPYSYDFSVPYILTWK